jgi:hypothetical protein
MEIRLFDFWVRAGCNPAAPNNALSAPRKMLFKLLDTDAARITFDGQTRSKEYLAHVYRITTQVLEVEEKLIEVVKTNCDLPWLAG